MRIAGVIAAAVIAVVVWLLLRDDERAVRAPTTAPSTPAAAAGAPAPAPSLPPADADVDAGPAHDPTSVLDATYGATDAIGRRCFTERTPRAVPPHAPDDTVGRLELRIKLEVAGGTARTTSATVVATRHLRDDVRDCIVAGVRAATWPIAVPDGAYELVQLFRMGDYVAVPSPDSPPPAPPRR